MKVHKIEYVLIALCTIAIATKILDIPTTGILTILSFSLYALYNLIIGIVKLKLFNSNLDKVLNVLTGIGTFGCSLAIMAIFMSFHNARIYLIGSAALTLITSFFIRIIAFRKNKPEIKYIFTKSIILGLIVLGIWLLPKYTIFKLKHLKDPKLVELYINKEEVRTDSARAAFSNYIDELWRKRRESKK